MADIEHGFRPTNPEEEPQKGSEDRVQDTPNMQSADHYQLPDSVQLPSDETLTPHGALDIQPHEQAHAEGLVTARRAETKSESLFSKWKRSTLAKIGTAALALGLTAGGVAKAIDNDNPAPAPQNTTSAPATTSPSEAAPTPSATESSTPAPTPELITPPNPELVTALENMTPAEFEQQPLESRMWWVVSHLQDEAENATTALAFTYTDPKTNAVESYTFKDGSEMARHNPIANLQDPTSGTELTRFSSPDDVLYYDLTVRNLSGAAMTIDEKFDQDKSRKWISANVADPKSAEYKDRVDSVEHSSQATALKNDLLHKYDVSGGTPLYKVSVEGKSYEAMTIEYSYGGGKAKAEYIFVPIEEMGQTEDGKQKGLWLETKKQLETVKPIAPN